MPVTVVLGPVMRACITLQDEVSADKLQKATVTWRDSILKQNEQNEGEAMDPEDPGGRMEAEL